MPRRADKRTTILLTGFGPFPGVSENLSGVLMRRLASRARTALPDFRFAVRILPTEWDRAPRLLRRLYAHQDPALALHFGVAARLSGLRIETAARNRCQTSPDAAGRLPDGPDVIAGARAQLAATLDARAIVRRLGEDGFDAALSEDAGQYLCNAVLYHSLAEADRRGGRCRVGFIHVPSEVQDSDELDRLVAAALEIVELGAHALREAPRPASV